MGESDQKMKKILNKIIKKRDDLDSYMNPKTKEDEHDYIMSNSPDQQCILHGKLEAYDEIIKLMKNEKQSPNAETKCS